MISWTWLQCVSLLLLPKLLEGIGCDNLRVQTTCGEDCQRCQQQALLDYLWSLDGPNWINNAGWPNESQPAEYTPLAHCTWYGVYCCSEDSTVSNVEDPAALQYSVTNQTSCTVAHGVAMILLGNNGLSGPLNSSFLGLSALKASLEVFRAENNSLTGSPQEGTTEAALLRHISFDSNGLSGTLPWDIFASPNLTYLSMASNSLTGAIPEFPHTSSLVYLDVSHNELNCTLPESWLDNPSLQYFAAGFNSLYGEIPGPDTDSKLLRGWSAMRGGLQIRLQGNSLTGPLPPALSYLHVQVLDLASNRLTGRIDDILAHLPVLKQLRVNSNHLTGSLPTTFASSHIEILSVKDNYLTGTLPESLGSLTDLTEVMIQNNNFSGDFPDSMKNLIGLEVLTALSSGFSYERSMPNRNGDFLPSWLYFDKRNNLYTSSSVYNFLVCKPLRVDKTQLPNLASLQVDPSYYHFQGCICVPGYTLVTVNQTKSCMAITSTFDSHRTMIVASVTAVSGAGIVAAIVTGLLWLLRVHIAAFTLQRAKKRGAPEEGRMVCLVSTDVEGSTELWEWNREAMDAATKVHDRIMRSKLSTFHGFEVNTEGDSFLIAFHEPADAVAWAIAMQQDLLMAKWPWQLQQHERTCMRFMTTGGPSPLSHQHSQDVDGSCCGLSMGESNASSALQNLGTPGESEAAAPPQEGRAEGKVSLESTLQSLHSLALDLIESPGDLEGTQSDIAYRGLSVRMMIVTGKAEKVTVHSITRRRDYEGEVVQLSKALSNVPWGGQILIDSATFNAISSNITEVGKLLLPQPNYELLTRSLRHRLRESQSLHLLQPIASGVPLPINPNNGFLRALSNGTSADLNGGIPRGRQVPCDSMDLKKLKEVPEKQGILSSAWGAISAPQKLRVQRDSATSFEDYAFAKFNAPRSRLLKTDSAKSEGVAFDHNPSNIVGGQRTWLDFLLCHFVRPRKVARKGGNENVILMDMGQHVIREWAEPQLLHQVLVPGLEDRARLAPDINSFEQITSGYFDAPAARHACLGGRSPSAPSLAPLPLVTLVFCAIEGLGDVKASVASTAAVALYLSCVRRLLKKTKGYECQEADGTFMLAFEGPADAAQFCLMVQEELMDEVWGEEVLKLPACRIVYGDKRQMLFHGPRVRMGIYEGVPTRVCPHTTTGRADYFGPLVNRAARFCLAAAYGGQIVAPIQTVEKVIAEWTQQPCPPLLEGNRPIVTVRADAVDGPLYDTRKLGPPLSRIQSVDPAFANGSCGLKETEKLKSIRVMDWIPLEPTPEQAPHLPPQTECGDSSAEVAVMWDRSSSSQSVPDTHSSGSNSNSKVAPAWKTSSGLLAEMQANALQRLRVSSLTSSQPLSRGGGNSPVPVVAPRSVSAFPLPTPVAAAAEEARRMLQAKMPARQLGTMRSPFADKAGKQPARPGKAQQGSEATRKELASCVGDPGTGGAESQHPSGSSLADAHSRQTLETTKLRGRSAYAVLTSAPDIFTRPSVLTIKSNDSGFVSMLQTDAWRTVEEVEAHHIGDMKFKGVHGVHTVMQLNNVRFSGRKFPSGPFSNKAEIVGPARGLAYSVIFNR